MSANICSSTLRFSERIFDTIEYYWKSDEVKGIIWGGIAVFFVLSGFYIELSRLGLLPFPPLPVSPLYSIHLAFTAVLVVEVIELILSLSRSFSVSVGKQLEIYSLILLRQAFEVLSSVDDITADFSAAGEHGFQLSAIMPALEHGIGMMLVEVACALGIFALLAFYERLHVSRKIILAEESEKSFIRLKKLTALLLLGVFIAFAVMASVSASEGEGNFSLFQNFYLALIYADILLILISYRYNNSYALIFRNSAFAACTLLVRLALSAPPMLGALLGLFSAALLPGITYCYNCAVAANAEE